MIRVWPYVILVIILSVFLRRIWKEKQGGWQFVSTAAVGIILTSWILVDTGLVGRHVVKMGDKEFYISSNAFEDVIARNIDNLGVAIANVYEKFYVVEIFDLSKQDERVKFVLEDGKPVCLMALKYQAVSSTQSAMISEGNLLFSPDESISKDGRFYKLLFSEDSVQKAIDVAKKANLKVEVKYFRKK